MYGSHVINAHVSFTSHVQKSPQATFAHIEPNIIPIVKKAIHIITNVSAERNKAIFCLNMYTHAIIKAAPKKA